MSGVEPGTGDGRRVLIRASAGSGKTFQLSNRYLELVARGASPGSILATTFTRKAAGEILERVLERAALAAGSPQEAKELGGHLGLDVTPEKAEEILLILVRELHRLQVGTLDSFFIRLAGVSSLELGLPPGWSIAEESRLREFASAALAEVLARGEPRALTELFRGLSQGAADRSVHQRLLGPGGFLREMVELSRQLDLDAEDPWRWTGGGAPLGEGEEERLRGEATALLASLPLPRTAAGAPNHNWVKARDSALADIQAGRWRAAMERGFLKAWLQGKGSFHGKRFEEVDPPQGTGLELSVGLAELGTRVARALAGEYRDRLEALGRLVELYRGGLLRIQDEAGGFAFSDVTQLLADGGEIWGEEEREVRRLALYYRLDARIQHLLLDEFQDTSLPQWWALAPLAEEFMSSGEGERSALVVADPKQSIYGWRGGEPRLLDTLERRFQLPGRRLVESWRSSPVILDAVNRVFQGLGETTLLQEAEPGIQETATRWLEDFQPHVAARGWLPGYVSVRVGPRGEERGQLRGTFLAWAAREVRQLHLQCPDASVGVLTRTNAAGRRLIHELRLLGVEASDEGGGTVQDSPAVAAFTSALHLMDHPGDTVARYLVAHSPLGGVVGVTHPPEPGGGSGEAGAIQAREFSRSGRQALLEEGYGGLLSRWVRALGDQLSSRERSRLEQLVELGFRFQGRAALRTRDFLRFVETARVEDPSTAPVRVMTVHRSKGLEFDVVVLPELGGPLYRGPGGVAFPQRGSWESGGDEMPGRIRSFLPGVPSTVAPLFPDVEAAKLEAGQELFRDSLSLLYVAMTRARHALHLWIETPPPGRNAGPGEVPGRTHARILVETLGRVPREQGWEVVTEGAELHASGTPNWWDVGRKRVGDGERAEPTQAEFAPGPPDGESPSPRIVRAPAGTRRRMRPRTSPSRLEGGSRVDLSWVLPLRGEGARSRGLLVHAWCQEVEWLGVGEAGGGAPSDEVLRRRAQELGLATPPGALEELLGTFREQLAAPAVAGALARDRYPGEVRLEREFPFILLDGGSVLEGVVDRVVVGLERGVPVSAEVLDFKTDRLDGDPEVLEARVGHYQPQIAAYRRAMAHRFRLPLDRVRGGLLFLESGTLVPVE